MIVKVCKIHGMLKDEDIISHGVKRPLQLCKYCLKIRKKRYYQNNKLNKRIIQRRYYAKSKQNTDWGIKNRNTNLKSSRKKVKELSDSYVISQLKTIRKGGRKNRSYVYLSNIDMPKKLIDLKREVIKLRREMRKQQNEDM